MQEKGTNGRHKKTQRTMEELKTKSYDLWMWATIILFIYGFTATFSSIKIFQNWNIVFWIGGWGLSLLVMFNVMRQVKVVTAGAVVKKIRMEQTGVFNFEDYEYDEIGTDKYAIYFPHERKTFVWDALKDRLITQRNKNLTDVKQEYRDDELMKEKEKDRIEEERLRRAGFKLPEKEDRVE